MKLFKGEIQRRKLFQDTLLCTKDGVVARKWFAVHGEELYSEPKFLITAEVKMSVMFGPNI